MVRIGDNTIILVQEIVSRWAAGTRSRWSAIERASIPEGFGLPVLDKIQYPLAVIYDKVTSFTVEAKHLIEIREFLPTQRSYFGCTWISMEDEKVSVTFSYNRNCGGAPERTSYPRKVLNLSVGNWGRIRYNGRFPQSEGPWVYHKTVFNIGYFKTVADISANLFLSEPPRTFSEMADLYDLKRS